MSLADNGRAVHARAPDEGEIRTGLRCGRSCECNRPRGKVHCPLHDAGASGKPDLSVDTKNGTVLVICRVCDKAGQADLIPALQERDLWPGREPAPVIRMTPGRTERYSRVPAPKLVSTTPYKIGDTHRHVRKDYDDGSKDCIWERLDGAEWRIGLNGTKVTALPLYGMERLKDLPAGSTVVLCEGEKATDAAVRLGLVAIGTVTGAKQIPDDAILQALVPFDVVRWDDHDDDGHKHMHRISERLVPLGGSSRVLTWADAPPRGDAADFLGRGGTSEQAAELVAAAAPFNPLAALPIINAVALAAMTFSEPKVIVPGLFVEGATMLVAPGKSGKSRLMMATAVGVAHGGAVLGSIPVEGGDVLYLALEDGKRRARARMLEASGGNPPARLDFAVEWPTMDNGGLEMIENWLRAKPSARLVVVDTLKRFRAKTNGRRNAYDEDYEALAPLNDLAIKYGVCIVIIHHTNKIRLSDDPTDRASGSTGMLAACDGMIVMERTRGQADSILHVFHRDLEDAKVAIKSDPDLGWKFLGDAAEYARTELQDQIVGVILGAGRPLRPGDVAPALNRDRKDVGQRMWQMARPNANGVQVLISQGGYYWPSSRPWPGPADDDDEESDNSRNRRNRRNREDRDNRSNREDFSQESLLDGGVERPVTPVTRDREERATGQPAADQGGTARPVTPVTPVWRCAYCRALERNGERCGGCGRPAS